ncbi:MAG TPA: hypothetical protein DCM38_00655 [Gammaproteobacteria bacterium]|nr:hypothetical protein [Candidatus Parabeggiatoa sp.]HAI67928.1 hypothetical protein [Gammaproteobacteria bacterium]
MFDEILNDSDLLSLLRSTCEENDICVELSEKLTEEKYLILKIDAYYNSSRIHNPPPSIDCLIIVKCDTNKCYDFYLVELRGIKSTKGFKIGNIQQKFSTTIDKFLKDEFASIFLNDDYCLNHFKLYFVSDGCRLQRFPDMTKEQYDKKLGTTKYGKFLLQKPYEFKNKKTLINPVLPNPMIKEC